MSFSKLFGANSKLGNSIRLPGRASFEARGRPGLDTVPAESYNLINTKEIRLRTNVRTKACLALAAVVALASALPLVAHHAVSAEFDSGKVVTLKGVVSKVDWVNPHIFIYLDVKDESGKVTTWRLQSVPPMFMKGSGLTKEKLLDGAEATVTAYPAKDGTDAFGFVLKLAYPDGHFYNLGGGPAPAAPVPAQAPAK
jgi:hypothetical protein